MQRFKEMKEMHGASGRDDRKKRELQRQERELTKMYLRRFELPNSFFFRWTKTQFFLNLLGLMLVNSSSCNRTKQATQKMSQFHHQLQPRWHHLLSKINGKHSSLAFLQKPAVYQRYIQSRCSFTGLSLIRARQTVTKSLTH